MLALSAAVWMLYVPHTCILRLLGPRLGMVWVRLSANVHWLLTFVGAQRSTRRALESMRPFFETDLPVSQLLRRHLLLKHECFARLRAYSFHGAASGQNDIKWRCHPSCLSAVPSGRRDRGLVIVGYHFNFYRLVNAALPQVAPGCDPVHLRYRSSQSVEKAASPIARLAMKKAAEADERSGVKVLYVDGKTAPIGLFRMLRNSGVVALTADGMVAADFIEVPFFDGVLRVPSGWARLAALSNSDLLILFDRRVDRHCHDFFFSNHVQCADASEKSVYAAVAESIRILEKMIRQEPWGWHPWQRLRVQIGEDGSRHYYLKQFGYNGGETRHRETMATPNCPITATLSIDGAASSKRPRVAILANSFPPYRIHLHERILAQVTEVELWSLSTHGNAYERWPDLKLPTAIHPVEFGHGEPTNQQTQLRYSLREWRKGGQIIRWLQEHEVGAVFCQGCGDVGRLRIIRWCRRHEVPCFLTGDFNIRGDNHRPTKRWIKRQVYQRAVGWSHGLMPCGKHGLALLHRYGGQQKPAFMFPFAPDVGLFENTPQTAIQRAQERFALDADRRRIVFSARMMAVKRPDLALAAFAAIAPQRPEWDLVMLGDGPLRPELERCVPPPLRDRVIWTGFLDDPADVAGLYALSDVLLLPSDHEPWGVVVVEAAAAGLAIVASDVVGASPELVHDGRNGAIFARGDLPALTDALLAVTAAERVDGAKRQSRLVFHEWLSECDPVAGFRAALRQCELPSALPAELTPEPTYRIGTLGAAVVPV